jgi:hypothetical protein
MPAADRLTVQELVRRQLHLFLRAAEQRGLGAEDQRRRFRLSRDDWQRWLGVLDDAPMPPHPALPLMLRHLGYVTHRLVGNADDDTAYS